MFLVIYAEIYKKIQTEVPSAVDLKACNPENVSIFNPYNHFSFLYSSIPINTYILSPFAQFLSI